MKDVAETIKLALALVGFIFVMGIVGSYDYDAEEAAEKHAEWIRETKVQRDMALQEKPTPGLISSPGFSGQPTLSARYQAIKDEHAEAKEKERLARSKW